MTSQNRSALTGFRKQLEQIHKELWLVLSIVAIAWLLNSVLSSQRMLLGLYTLPTVVSAYLYGRCHATLTALASTLLVVYLQLTNSVLLGHSGGMFIQGQD